jgi:hypothetical protein
VQLTRPQIEAVLAVARSIDAKPGDLNQFLPTVAQRAVFRGAMKALEQVRDTTPETTT